MAAKKKRGFGGTCAIVVEQAGSKRKVVADMAEARTLVKRLAERHPTKQVKVTRACSTGRGARGETIAACTGRKCWGALSGARRSGVRGTTAQHEKAASDYAAGAMRSLELARTAETPGMRRTFMRQARQAVDAGQTECTWVAGRGLEPKACREVRKAEEALYFAETKRRPRGASGVRGTREQHQEQVEYFIRDAEHATDEAKKAKGAKQRGLALRAFKSIEKADAVCGWAGGVSCNESVVSLRDEILPMVLTSAAEKAAFHQGFAGTRRKKK